MNSKGGALCGEEAEFQRCEQDVAALLSYFWVELSELNLVSRESLVFAGISSDWFTGDVAVVAGLWLEHLLHKLNRFFESDFTWVSYKKWVQSHDLEAYRIVSEFENTSNPLDAFTEPLVKDSYLVFCQKWDGEEECRDPDREALILALNPLQGI